MTTKKFKLNGTEFELDIVPCKNPDCLSKSYNRNAWDSCPFCAKVKDGVSHPWEAS